MAGSDPRDDDTRSLASPPLLVADRMLRICLGGEQPLVEAARRSAGSVGEVWWTRTIEAVAGAGRDPLPPLVPGEADPALIERWKEAAKRWSIRSDPPDAPVRGTAVYLLATALALCDHGRMISSRPGSELVPAWLDLAGAAPAPWAEVLARAALLLEKGRSSRGTAAQPAEPGPGEGGADREGRAFSPPG